MSPSAKLFLNVDDPADWSEVFYCDKAADTEHVISSLESPPQSVKFTKKSGNLGGACKTSFTATDLRNTNVEVTFYVHEGVTPNSWDNIDSVQVGFATSDGNNLQILMLADSGDITEPGWYVRGCVPKMDSVDVGDYDSLYSACDNARVQFYAKDADYTPSVTYDRIAVFDELTTPLYLLFFDDGYANDFKYAQYLAAKGLRATFAIIPWRIGQSGWLSIEQLYQMRQMGHCIVNHGYYSLYKVTGNIPDNEYRKDIYKGYKWLAEKGFGDTCDLFVVPGGSDNWKESWFNTFRTDYIRSIRLTRTGTDWFTSDPRRCWVNVMDSTADAESIRSALSGTGAVGASLFHTINEGTDWTEANLKSHIDNLATNHNAGTIKVVTFDEYYNIIRDFYGDYTL